MLDTLLSGMVVVIIALAVTGMIVLAVDWLADNHMDRTKKPIMVAALIAAFLGLSFIAGMLVNH